MLVKYWVRACDAHSQNHATTGLITCSSLHGTGLSDEEHVVILYVEIIY